MSSLLSWFGLTVACAVSVILGLRFRRGHHRRYARWYRDASLPAAMRHAPIVLPVAGALWLPLLLVSGPIFMGLTVEVDLPGRLAALGVFAAAGYFFISIAVVDLLLYRLPRRMIPSWLRDEDEDLGYIPPPPDRFDRSLLAVAVPFLLVGVALVIWGFAIGLGGAEA